MGIAANWSRENLAWAGGLFEGEGSIGVNWGKFANPRLRITSTDPDVLRRFGGIMGCGSLNGPYTVSKAPHWKPKYVYTIGGGRMVYASLAALWPYLGARRKDKAEEVMRFIATMRPYKKKRTKNVPIELLGPPERRSGVVA